MAYIQDFSFSLPSSQVQEEQPFPVPNNQTIDNCKREIELETHNLKNVTLNIGVVGPEVRICEIYCAKGPIREY